MALRILEVYHPPVQEGDIEALLESVEVIKIWHEKISATENLTKILMLSVETGKVLNIIEKKFGMSECFRILILPVEASLPRHKSDENENNVNNSLINIKRISIEEIYQKMVEAARPTYTYYIFIILAAIVASIGLINNDTAVVIGSMVIAPLISPNMALALATTLADTNLISRSLFASVTAYLIVFVIGMTFGELFAVTPTGAEIFTRIDLNLFYVIIALCSGVAGALSLTKGVSQLLVGVMVAVAILPPLVSSGLLLGSDYLMESFGAFLLFTVNVVCINIAAVATFLFQGVTPKSWWMRKKAKEWVGKALRTWFALLIILVILIIIYDFFFDISIY